MHWIILRGLEVHWTTIGGCFGHFESTCPNLLHSDSTRETWPLGGDKTLTFSTFFDKFRISTSKSMGKWPRRGYFQTFWNFGPPYRLGKITLYYQHTNKCLCAGGKELFCPVCSHVQAVSSFKMSPLSY